MTKRRQKNNKGFGILEILIASAVIGLAIAGALQFQEYMSRSLAAKRVSTQLDKVEFQIRTLLSDVRNLQKSANLSSALTATGNNALLADCLTKRDASSIRKSCTTTSPGPVGTTSITFFRSFDASNPTRIWFSDLTTTNANPQNDADDDVLSSTLSDRSKPFWQFQLVRPPGNATDAVTSATGFSHFTLDGEPCPTATATPTAACPVQVSVYFRPICQPGSGGSVVTQCHQAQRVRLRYLITVPQGAPGMRGLAASGNMRRTGSFTHTVAGLNSTLNVRYRFRDSPFQTCMAIYQNRKELKFAACTNRILGNNYLATSHFTHTAVSPIVGSPSADPSAFGIFTGSGTVGWNHTTKEENLGTQAPISAVNFLSIPIAQPCTFSVVAYTWVPKCLDCGAEANGRCNSVTTECGAPTARHIPLNTTYGRCPAGSANYCHCGTNTQNSYFSRNRKCGLYVSFYESVTGKSGVPIMLVHNTGNTWDDFRVDWANMSPLTLFSSMRAYVDPTQSSPPTSQFLTTPATTVESYKKSRIVPRDGTVDTNPDPVDHRVKTNLTDLAAGAMDKSLGLWPTFENGPDNHEAEYYFKLEDGGDWGNTQDLSVIDFGMQVFVDPRVCRHVGWEGAIDP